MAAAYLIVGLSGREFAGITAGTLVKIMKVEFLVVHSGAFLFLMLGMVRFGPPATRRKWAVAAAAFLLYIAASLSEGVTGLLIFLSAIGATYRGVFRGTGCPLAGAIGRWAAALAAYFLCIISCRLPENADTRNDRMRPRRGFPVFPPARGPRGDGALPDRWA
jgi:hypothetical protein